MNFDRIVVEQLNHLATHWGPLADASRWAAGDLQYVFVTTLVVGCLLEAIRAVRRGRLEHQLVEAPVVALLALALGLGLNHLVGAVWFRPRPFDAIPGLHLLVPPSGDPSFPSDHATAVFTLALGIGLALPWLRNVLLIQGILLLTARIAVGLHFPSDIAAGLCIALVAVAAAEQAAFHARTFLHVLARRTAGCIAQVAPPSDVLGAPGRHVATAAVFTTLVGLPALIEAAGDPIRFNPAWLEDTVLGAALLVLGLLAVFVVQSPRFAQAVGANERTRHAG